MKKLFVALLLALSACQVGPFPRPPPQPEPPSPWDYPTDAAPAPEEDSGSPCAAACVTLARYGCEESKPTAGGATCTQVCENIESSGVVSMNPDCVSHAESCSIARACMGEP